MGTQSIAQLRLIAIVFPFASGQTITGWVLANPVTPTSYTPGVSFGEGNIRIIGTCRHVILTSFFIDKKEIQMKQMLLAFCFEKTIIFSWCHQERHLDFKRSQSTKVERKNKLSNFLVSRYHGSPTYKAFDL